MSSTSPPITDRTRVALPLVGWISLVGTVIVATWVVSRYLGRIETKQEDAVTKAEVEAIVKNATTKAVQETLQKEFEEMRARCPRVPKGEIFVYCPLVAK